MMDRRFAIDGVRYRSREDIDRYLQTGDWLDFTAGEALRAAALERPGKTAIVGHDGQLTFSILDQRSESLAASLIEAGLQPGDRALFQIGVVKELFVLLYACFKAGIVPVCTLPQHRDIEIGHLAKRSQARALFVQGDVHPTFDQLGFSRRMKAAISTIEYLGATRGAAASDELALDNIARCEQRRLFPHRR